MRYLVRHLLVVGAVVGALWAITAWPRINDVETGKTPEYPDLVPHDYGAGVPVVVKAIKRAAARLPRWEIVGEGSGPAAAEIQAVHTTRLLRFKDDVFVKVQRRSGRTYVSVHSKSRIGKWDFGQNARNVRELLAALDQEVF
jgi:uncharacterized protein (DUF1499 family)